MNSLIRVILHILRHPLARRHKLMALKRFLGYQISQLLFPSPVMFEFTDRTNLIIEKGMTGATGNVYFGLHEFEDMSFLLHFLRPKDTFIDVGANVGTYTILASGHIGAETIALEPVPATFAKLKRNITYNFLDQKITPVNAGVGSNSKTLKFTSTLGAMNHVATDEENAEIIEVRMEPLDDLLRGVSPTLIKIDVEGFETEVLQGAIETLNNSLLKAIIIELNGSGTRYGFSEEYIHQILLQYHFIPYSYEPFKRFLNPLESFGSGNTIYIRDIRFVEERIQTAHKIRIMGEFI